MEEEQGQLELADDWHLDRHFGVFDCDTELARR